MLLYIVRHGDPIYETDSLTERGKLQAEAVAKRLVRSGINRIFSSPMGRARMTAEPTCRLLNLSYTVENWAHEIEDERLTPFPDGIPKSISEVQNTYYRADGMIDLSYEDGYRCQGFDQTRMKEAVSRIEAGGKDFLERLGYREENGIYRILSPNEDRVALFCHAAMARAWLSTLLHIPIHLVWAGFDYPTTGVTVLQFRNNENGVTAPKCLCFADMSHLYAHGPDMIHNTTGEI